MKKVYILTILSQFLWLIVIAQVKPEFLYNPNTSFGTLDLRTKISESTYYYLQENQTFSFREDPVGERTNTYLDMTTFDSSPFTEGHLRKKDGGSDYFIMNYRLLFPL